MCGRGVKWGREEVMVSVGGSWVYPLTHGAIVIQPNQELPLRERLHVHLTFVISFMTHGHSRTLVGIFSCASVCGWGCSTS
jgi:hypothetical protein